MYRYAITLKHNLRFYLFLVIQGKYIPRYTGGAFVIHKLYIHVSSSAWVS